MCFVCLECLEKKKKQFFKLGLSGLIALIVLIMSIAIALCERTLWDCPECGRTGNSGNYCGSCAHPAPWVSTTKNKIEIGSYVTFGVYPQTSGGNDLTPIEWLVLDREQNKVLLISKHGLDTKEFFTFINGWLPLGTKFSWETSDLRKWLNEDFFQKAFTSDEKKAILVSFIDNGRNQGYSGWSTYGGNDTQDRVFLLSYAEANKYFDVQHYEANNRVWNNKKSRVSPTAYAIKQGPRVERHDNYTTEEGETAVSWWLRSPGDSEGSFATILFHGALSSDGSGADYYVIRPAIWINLEISDFQIP